MDFDNIFTAYYTLYRTEAEIPDSTDDEYTIAMRLANEAIRRWSRFDNTYWAELFTTLIDSGEGTTIVTDQTDYDCPEDFKEAGGLVRVLNSDGNVQQYYPIINPQEVQFKDTNTTFAYFFNNPVEGYQLRLNPAPTSSLNGMTLDYAYYKEPTLFTTGTDVTEMSEPYYIVHRMLASRFRGSRNPFRNDAKGDAEDALKTMQIRNNSGTWSNPFVISDTSGTTFGV